MDWSWRERGKCWGTYTTRKGHKCKDHYFPPEPSSTRRNDEATVKLEARARELCAGCPVMEQCLDYAVEQSGIRGIWGGTLTHQRTLIRRYRARGRLEAAERVRNGTYRLPAARRDSGREHSAPKQQEPAA